MKVPRIFISNNKKYYFVELSKNFARYQTGKGISECFTFHELGMIEEMAEPYKPAYKGGEIMWQNVK